MEVGHQIQKVMQQMVGQEAGIRDASWRSFAGPLRIGVPYWY